MLKLTPFLISVFLIILFVSLTTPITYADKELGGVGVIVAQLFEQNTKNKIGPLIVINVIEKTPAVKAGIEKGDIITKIDNEPTIGKDFMELISQRLRGKVGTIVKLTIWRAEGNKTFNVKLKRSLVKPPSR